ncbi:MAG: glycosyltransferase family 4 protein [Bryobacteraceae bacterium]|nr:glycosyltransferase family 4 protein [Bryobacteraceae bacterium]
MPLKILFDARHVRDFGYGTYIRNLLRGFAAIRAPHEFLLAMRAADRAELADLPGNFRFLAYERPDTEPRDRIAFSLFARRQKPSLVHIPLARVPLFLPRPYVVTVHDISSLVLEKSSGWRGELEHWLLRRSLLGAAAVIAVSEWTKNDLISLLGLPPEKVRRIYGAVDPQFTQQTRAEREEGDDGAARERERRRELERYQVHYPYLLYAGTIRPQKNIPRLVEAFALVRGRLQDHPLWKDLRLIIIGDEISRYPAVRQAVIQSRVEPYVRFLGFVPIDTLRMFYESAAAFVFPSLYEGFGLPPLEAMACGTPVVCSDAASLPEAIGDAAEIISPDNVFDIARGILEVLLNEDRRRLLIERGYQRCREFRWEDTAARVLAIYEAVAAGRPLPE